MCKQCEINPVYEFTNQRKLCEKCFVRYFQKKVLYTIRKFNMVKKEDVVGYYQSNYLLGVVLEDVLKMFAEKFPVKIKKFQRTKDTMTQTAKRLKVNEIAWPSTIDLVSYEIVNEIINGNVRNLMEDVFPVEELGKKTKIIKPLYLFLDKEVLLYAKLRKLKFKKINVKLGKISKFIDELEKTHPEVKRAIVNSCLKLRA